jgi:hypothetical protein
VLLALNDTRPSNKKQIARADTHTFDLKRNRQAEILNREIAEKK